MKTYILITGASSGIGYEMAQQLAAKQYNLILTARNTLKLAAIVLLRVSFFCIFHDLMNNHVKLCGCVLKVFYYFLIF